ncbi:uncharacterized protein BDZ99DRAFT_521191 [Mytilinidion resinicola]|uniref:Uncharacterized protein n=1 Tax=Mytilinidion resinicola TaxID=574789 RepID=A0A6A6YJI9_9PEZI|nr:uncharacterized protein BDZ99DRAFT_521191 [Mytilinidion resinicola]KAF2808693.1 hypothetical protein BDZ99DRAFT_521191 [Mytilinidion resinicola]
MSGTTNIRLCAQSVVGLARETPRSKDNRSRSNPPCAPLAWAVAVQHPSIPSTDDGMAFAGVSYADSPPPINPAAILGRTPKDRATELQQTQRSRRSSVVVWATELAPLQRIARGREEAGENILVLTTAGSGPAASTMGSLRLSLSTNTPQIPGFMGPEWNDAQAGT